LAKAHTKDFKNLLDKFVNKLGDNYNFYLQEVVGYDEIDTDANIKIKKNNKVIATETTMDKTHDNPIVIDRKL
jgi:hypothetical protein